VFDYTTATVNINCLYIEVYNTERRKQLSPIIQSIITFYCQTLVI
jgi:hypothetical protein